MYIEIEKQRGNKMRSKRGYESIRKANKSMIYDERGAATCKFCKKNGKTVYPKIVVIEDLYYAQCSNPKCHHSDPYEYLGMNIKRTIDNWNRTMEGRQNELL